MFTMDAFEMDVSAINSFLSGTHTTESFLVIFLSMILFTWFCYLGILIISVRFSLFILSVIFFLLIILKTVHFIFYLSICLLMDPWIGSILAIVNIAAIKVTAQINISEHLLSLLLETYSKEECIVIE